MPLSISSFLISLSITKSGSLYSARSLGSSDKYVDTDAYLDFGILNLLFFSGYSHNIRQSHYISTITIELTFNPLSSSVLSSTAPLITFHLTSTSAKNPLNIGAAAVNASIIGPIGAK